MRKRTELDERQLWQRGNVFKHAFVFLLGAPGGRRRPAKPFGITWAEGPWEAVLLIWASVALCWWEFILRDISPMGEEPEDLLFRHGPVRPVHRGDGAGVSGGRPGPAAEGGHAHLRGGPPP